MLGRVSETLKRTEGQPRARNLELDAASRLERWLQQIDRARIRRSARGPKAGRLKVAARLQAETSDIKCWWLQRDVRVRPAMDEWQDAEHPAMLTAETVGDG